MGEVAHDGEQIGYVVASLLLGYPALQNSSAHKTASPDHDKILQQELDSEASKISGLEKNLTDLKNELSLYQFELGQKQQRYDTVLLDPSSHGFQRLDTDTASFLVSVQNIVPYINGYKLTVNIGNPTTATFSGITIKIRWAKAYDWHQFSTSSYAVWQKSIQEKSFPVTDDLRPGSWNSVDLLLLPAAADDLGYLELSMTTSTTSLHTN